MPRRAQRCDVPESSIRFNRCITRSQRISRYWRETTRRASSLRDATVVGPAFWIGYFQLAWAHERLGNMELALEALKDAETFASGNSKMISLRGCILAMSGRRNEAASAEHLGDDCS